MGKAQWLLSADLKLLMWMLMLMLVVACLVALYSQLWSPQVGHCHGHTDTIVVYTSLLSTLVLW